MILENTKLAKYISQPLEILRLFLAFVFLSAGLFRIFRPESAVLEFRQLQLPAFLSLLTIIFELISGLCLLFNKFTKIIYKLLVCFLFFILIWGLMINGSEILRRASDLFVFTLNPTDFFLHFIFLLLVLVLLLNKKNIK